MLAATGLGIAGLATAVVVALGAFSAGAAYAVTTNPDGTVTITLSQFSALPALNQELAQDRLPLKAVPVTATCPFNPSVPTPPHIAIPPGSHNGLAPTDTITIATSDLVSERAVGVIGVKQTTSGHLLMMEAGTRAPGPPCINSAAFR
jgi:hypothetical protein